jgi:hypothetical protein
VTARNFGPAALADEADSPAPTTAPGVGTAALLQALNVLHRDLEELTDRREKPAPSVLYAGPGVGGNVAANDGAIVNVTVRYRVERLVIISASSGSFPVVRGAETLFTIPAATLGPGATPYAIFDLPLPITLEFGVEFQVRNDTDTDWTAYLIAFADAADLRDGGKR